MIIINQNGLSLVYFNFYFKLIVVKLNNMDKYKIIVCKNATF